MTDVKDMTKSALAAAGKANPAKGDSPLTDPKGIAAAGVTIAALPLVVGGIGKLLAPKVSQLQDKASDLGDQVKEKATDQVKEKADELTPDMPKKLFGGGLGNLFGGGDDHDDDDEGAGEGSAAPGHGSGRRMPIQQSVDVAVPLKTAYNQWTRFEDWPEFMHRLESVDQIDDSTVAFQTKIWVDQEAVRGRDPRAAAGRADRVGRHAGVCAHRRGHLPRAERSADPDRDDPRRRARQPHRQGQPWYAVRQAGRTR